MSAAEGHEPPHVPHWMHISRRDTPAVAALTSSSSLRLGLPTSDEATVVKKHLLLRQRQRGGLHRAKNRLCWRKNRSCRALIVEEYPMAEAASSDYPISHTHYFEETSQALIALSSEIRFLMPNSVSMIKSNEIAIIEAAEARLVNRLFSTVNSDDCHLRLYKMSQHARCVLAHSQTPNGSPIHREIRR